MERHTSGRNQIGGESYGNHKSRSHRAGAIGAYFLWGMRELPREDICLIAKGERKERLIRNGIIINGERYDYPVKEPQEAGKVDLLLVATKYGALSSILKDAQAVVDFFAKTTCKCTFKPDIIT